MLDAFPGMRRGCVEQAMWRSMWQAMWRSMWQAMWQAIRQAMCRAPLLAAGALLAGACARQPVRVGVDPATGSARVRTGAQLGYAPKRVVSKEPPGTLVASDGTVCRVAAERYERTKLGKAAACSWQLAFSDPER
jgi:hypothetical protein